MSRLPPPNGHAWADARADLMRRCVGWSYRHSHDLARTLTTMAKVMGWEEGMAPQLKSVEELLLFVEKCREHIGLDISDVPWSVHSQGVRLDHLGAIASFPKPRRTGFRRLPIPEKPTEKRP